MGQVTANGIRIEAERRGRADASALMLVRGLGSQMIQWPEPLVDLLASEHQVILFDNRDAGKSQKFDELGMPDRETGAAPPYRLLDMAADAVGVLDAFGIERAHVLGISMGGMIVQELAARYPARTRSLVSIMATSGDPSLPPPTPAAMAALLTPPEHPEDRACVVEHGLAARRVLGSPGYPDPDDALRDELGRAFDRCHHPQGVARQMAAILGSGSRVELLRTIRVPSLVIHGAEDPLAPVEGGRDTARRIPGAVLEVIEGMGHDLPLALAPRLAALILAHTSRCDASDAAA